LQVIHDINAQVSVCSDGLGVFIESGTPTANSLEINFITDTKNLIWLKLAYKCGHILDGLWVVKGNL
jgi:hypothetical protein